jgi:hypothetical protein
MPQSKCNLSIGLVVFLADSNERRAILVQSQLINSVERLLDLKGSSPSTSPYYSQNHKSRSGFRMENAARHIFLCFEATP